jgi:alkaline phosphatase D
MFLPSSFVFRFLLLTALLFPLGCANKVANPRHALSTLVFAGNAALQSGPMLGYADLREVLVWVQAKGPVPAVLRYWEAGKPETMRTLETVTPQARTAYTMKWAVGNLEPGRTYQYEILFDGIPIVRPYPLTFTTQPIWRWRTDPPTFSVATGSCAYINETEYDRPGTPYGSDYQIFGHIAAQKPNLMLWLGDNVYYREPDWSTRSGMLHRYTHDRSTPELQSLLAATSHYAIWDDHDYGPNDSDGTWIHKETAAEVFEAFWGNPTYGIPGSKGCTTFFQYNDIDFFLLDNRYYRAPNECGTCPRTALGQAQTDWLLAALAASQAPFKMVAIGGQMLTTNDNSETHWHFFKEERDAILEHIEKEKIKGVIFLTGDQHFTELSRYKNRVGNWVYDLTTSAFTSGSFKNAATLAPNANRVEGTVTDEHNFSIMQFSGPRKERRLEIKVFDAKGALRWTRTILPDGELQ